uniref:Cysteine proteinase inhibitor n=1 Tax=Rhizophora mucronata TaxID=61149 RepID=A0A2P2J930_RHIMU
MDPLCCQSGPLGGSRLLVHLVLEAKGSSNPPSVIPSRCFKGTQNNSMHELNNKSCKQTILLHKMHDVYTILTTKTSTKW